MKLSRRRFLKFSVAASAAAVLPAVPERTTYAAGMQIRFFPGNTNTGLSTECSYNQKDFLIVDDQVTSAWADPVGVARMPDEDDLALRARILDRLRRN